MGPHCTVRLEYLLVAIWMTLTLEPIKSLCTISTLRLVFFGLMVSLSHLQRLCHSIFRRVLEYDTLWMGSLWHFGRRFSGKAFAFWVFHGMGFPPRTLLEFQTISLRLEIEPFWMFVAPPLLTWNDWNFTAPLATWSSSSLWAGLPLQCLLPCYVAWKLAIHTVAL